MTVRQLIYGNRRRSYRILFFIVEPEDDSPGVVRVLHVLHGAQQGPGETPRHDTDAPL